MIPILKGMWAIILFGMSGVGAWRFSGVPFYQAWVTLVVYSVIVILLTFFFVNMAEKLWKRIRETKTGQLIVRSQIVSKAQSLIERLRSSGNGTNHVKQNIKKKLLKTAPWLVLLLYYLPFPVLGEAVVITAKAFIDTKVLKMRWTLPILFVGVIFKGWLTCVIWYQKPL